MAVPQVQVLDDRGVPLIPHDQLFFVDASVAKYSGVTWNPPANYWDALRYGRDVALAILRVAPEGTRQRIDDVGCLAGIFMLDLQFGNGKPRDGRGADAAIFAFWDAMLHFIFEEPTYHNVEAFRARTELARTQDEITALRGQLVQARKRKPGKAVRK